MKQAKKTARSSQPLPKGLKSAGLALSGFGFLVTAIGYLSSGAPTDSDTLNIGLLNDKTNLVLIGGFMFLSGVICLAIESATQRLLMSQKG